MELDKVTLNSTALRGGFLFLLWILSGLYGLMYLPSKLIVKDNAIATSQRILHNELLFRSGIVNDLLSSILWIFLVFTLYHLFRQVNHNQAKLLVAIVIVQIPVTFFMGAFNLATLMILKGKLLKTFDLAQRQDLAMLFLKIGDYENLTLEMYWGLWLFPLALLSYKSGFIPRYIGIWLFISGIAYVILGLVALLIPEYYATLFKFSFPAMLGEPVFMLWLLIIGVKKPLVNKKFTN